MDLDLDLSGMQVRVLAAELQEVGALHLQSLWVLS